MAEEKSETSKKEVKSSEEKLTAFYTNVVNQLKTETNIVTRYELNIVQQTLAQVYNILFKEEK